MAELNLFLLLNSFAWI